MAQPPEDTRSLKDKIDRIHNESQMAHPFEDTRNLKDRIERIHNESQNIPPKNKDEPQKASSDMPPIPLRSRTNKEFAAWAEYLGEEKDVEFIEWKKRMVGEGQTQFAPSEASGKRDGQGENKNKK
ncbi:hypothetical protein A1O3_04258 [Capronia epimyces CBS 606.96]|uniref:Uncharacterized protein n=1 Tax=Capronia epimyces CBS 606.96 TaxID=1182542 RepID=W9YYC4_9EURO|nr:uncharacterized protein A1O3_04258 [Capronia epimyces CBS 606.96]EXJ87299.1 hypothetical protein A1O3_04258 [Capronia epimyces CBS 606.96]